VHGGSSWDLRLEGKKNPEGLFSDES
jgi:hypothetical protein